MLIRWRNNSGFPAMSNMFDDFFNNDLTSFFGRDMSDFFNRNQNMVMPAVNIKESQDNYQIEVAAPGLRKEDFQLHFQNNVLTISAQKETRNTFEPNQQNQAISQGAGNASSGTENQTTSNAGDNQNTGLSQTSGGQSTAMQGASQNQPQRYTRQEFSYSSFQRSFTLPEGTEPEQISANYQDGILLITVPKRQQPQVSSRRSINIS